jgi:hypothetical protein
MNANTEPEDDLGSSSAHRDKGLMSPNMRLPHLCRIVSEMRSPEYQNQPVGLPEQMAASDLCYRLYSAAVADVMASRLGTTRQAVREALDAALQWRDHP